MYIYYVYAYINKTTGLPYYIGKGKGNRAFQKHKNVPTPKDISKIVFLETNLSEIGSLALERRYILWYGCKDINTGILRNLTDGGEGTSGRNHNEIQRKKCGDAWRGKVAWNKDKKQPRKSKVNRSKYTIDYNNINTGFKQKKECPYCLKSFDLGNYKRYHGEKCKLMQLFTI